MSFLNSSFQIIKNVVGSRKFQVGLLIIVLLIAIVVIVLSALRMRYALGIDTISYISVAKHYLHGRFEYAFNAFWSPMVIWLLVPFLFIGFSGSEAFLAVNVLAAMLILASGLYFLTRYVKDSWLWKVVYIIIVTPFLAKNISTLMPDMLLAAWALWFGITLVWASERLIDNKAFKLMPMVAVGVMGAIGYFIKLYALPVVIVVVAVWLVVLGLYKYGWRDILRFYRQPGLKVVVAGMVVLAVMIGVMAPWVAGLSWKYDRLMLGSSATNVSNKFHQTDFLETDDSYEILQPPNPYAVAIGEDRTEEWAIESNDTQELGLKSRLWDTLQKIRAYGHNRLDAFPFYLNRINSIWPIILPVLVLVGAGLLFNKLTIRKHYYILAPWLVLGVYFAGYALVVSRSSGGGNDRYYWPLFPLAASIFLACLPLLIGYFETQKLRLNKIIFIALALLISLIPVAQYVYGYGHVFHIRIGNPLSFGSGGPSQRLELFAGPPKSADMKLAEKIADDGVIPAQSKLIGNNYRRIVRIAYHNEAQAYGRSELNYDYTDPKFRQMLRDMGIDYFLMFKPDLSEDRQARRILELHSELTVDEIVKMSGAEVEPKTEKGDHDAEADGSELAEEPDVSGISEEEVDWIVRYAQPYELHPGDEIVATYQQNLPCADLRSPQYRPCVVEVIKLK